MASWTSATADSNSSPLIVTGRPWTKPIVTSSVAISTAGSQNRTPMIGSTVSMPVSRCSSVFASCVAPQMFASVEYAFSVLSRYGRSWASSHSDISLRPPSSATKSASSQGL
ncbi:Uncharacterised protein [Mycobacteroides abscessus]|nr:Uncharacterised protein [Mycobacteroides abscessus]